MVRRRVQSRTSFCEFLGVRVESPRPKDPGNTTDERATEESWNSETTGRRLESRLMSSTDEATSLGRHRRFLWPGGVVDGSPDHGCPSWPAVLPSDFRARVGQDVHRLRDPTLLVSPTSRVRRGPHDVCRWPFTPLVPRTGSGLTTRTTVPPLVECMFDVLEARVRTDRF